MAVNGRGKILKSPRDAIIDSAIPSSLQPQALSAARGKVVLLVRKILLPQAGRETHAATIAARFRRGIQIDPLADTSRLTEREPLSLSLSLSVSR